MILSKHRLFTVAHVYFDQEPKLGGFDIVHRHQHPVAPAGRRCEPFSTLLIDLGKDPEQLLADMRSKTRRVICQMERNGPPEYQRWNDPDDDVLRMFSELMSRSAAAKRLEVGTDDLWKFRDEKVLTLSLVRDADGTPLVWRSYLRSIPRARNLRAGTLHMLEPDSARRQLIGRLNRYGLWRDLLAFRDEGFTVFDLGGWYAGSEDAEKLQVNEFKKSFGGYVVEEFNYLEPKSWKGRLLLSALYLKERLRSKRDTDVRDTGNLQENKDAYVQTP